jgi:hypothetical protein
MSSFRVEKKKKTNRGEEVTRNDNNRGKVPFVNVTARAKAHKLKERGGDLKTPRKRRNATMAFGKWEEKSSSSADSTKVIDKVDEKKKKKKKEEEEEKEEKIEEEEEILNISAWIQVVTMLQHVDAFMKDVKEDPEIIANAHLWKDGRFFPIAREALLASSSSSSTTYSAAAGVVGPPIEEKERAVGSMARKVRERWEKVKRKRVEDNGDAKEIILGMLETLEEEMAEAHRVGQLLAKKNKKETTEKNKKAEGENEAELKAPLNFGEIIAQEMAAKEALWKPKEEEENEDEEDEACEEHLSVLQTRCPARRNFEMRCEVRTKCASCKDVSYYEEAMMLLSLDMPSLNSANNTLRHHPLEVQLKEYFRTKVIEHRCAKCGADVAEESRYLTQLPRYLLIHINRFVWVKKKDDPTVNERRKVCWRVSCPKNLPIGTLPKSSKHTHPPEACPSTTSMNNDKSDGVYSLHSVLLHCGEDEEGGRTVLHVRNKKAFERGGIHHKETWTTHDMDMVGTSGNARINETEKFERETYLLLYSHPDFTF